jgi:hypothetical protein
LLTTLAASRHCASRYRAAAATEGVSDGNLEEDWENYLDGVWGVCLRTVTPEAIVRKSVLVS